MLFSHERTSLSLRPASLAVDTVSVFAAAAPLPTQQPSSSSSGTAACKTSLQSDTELLQLMYSSRRCQSNVGGFAWYCLTHELAGTTGCEWQHALGTHVAGSGKN
jgi:hypothetical protein